MQVENIELRVNDLWVEKDVRLLFFFFFFGGIVDFFAYIDELLKQWKNQSWFSKYSARWQRLPFLPFTLAWSVKVWYEKHKDGCG